MDLGFETIGNATIIVHDRRPILATDPWIEGSAFFGSWGLSHAIPPMQLRAIETCPWIWLSHGHPDHLHGPSLDKMIRKTLLLPDHVGGRIAHEMRDRGFSVKVLPDRRWIDLSPRVRIMCISDYNQDAVLLIDINGRLIVNVNDAVDHGWADEVRSIVRQSSKSFYLALSTLYDELDMINVFDDGGERMPIVKNAPSLGYRNARKTEEMGATHFVPFSSLHRYQRADSVWAQRYRSKVEDYEIGFESATCRLLPAFLRYNCVDDSFEAIDPPIEPETTHDPKEFGDDWSETLEADDQRDAERYFRSIAHLSTFLDFVNLRVGGRDNITELAAKKFARGITIEAPRHSLMTSIRNEIFDDILIGNFAKVTLHGAWGEGRLYPDFTPYVAKFADNGRVRTPEEIADYLSTYIKRAPFDFLRFHVRRHDENPYRRYVKSRSVPARLLDGACRWIFAR